MATPFTWRTLFASLAPDHRVAIGRVALLADGVLIFEVQPFPRELDGARFVLRGKGGMVHELDCYVSSKG
jgi:hypothetical protein